MSSSKIDKKRKRASDRHDRPSKKPALELQDLPPLATSVVQDNSELAPVIGMSSVYSLILPSSFVLVSLSLHSVLYFFLFEVRRAEY